MTRKLSFFFTLIFVLILISGCSKRSDDLLENIPGDAIKIAVINLDSISIKAGCKFDSTGAIILSPSLKALENYEDEASRSLIGILLRNANYINSIDLVWFVRPVDNVPIVLFEILDKDALNASLASNAIQCTEIDGFSKFEYPGCFVMTKGKFGWVSTNAESIINAEKKLDDGNITENKHIKEFLRRSHDVNVLVRNLQYENGPLEYALIIAECKNGGLFAQCSFMDQEGKIFSFRPYIHDVDRKLLSFIPPKTQLLFAFGEILSWQEISDYIEENPGNWIPEDFVANFKVFKNFLTLIDGTTLLAVAPVDGTEAVDNISLDSWQTLLLTHMSEMDTHKILSIGENFFNTLGMKTEDTDSATYNISFRGMDMTFGDVDGNLYISNYNILDGGNTEIMPEYEGKKFVFNISIPKDSETAKRLSLPWGVNFNLSLHHNNIQVVLRLPGAEKPVLQEVIDRMTNI